VYRPDLGRALGLFIFSRSPAPSGGGIYRKLRQKSALHRQARTCAAFIMAKKHQRTDDLIDALVWMRRQESSPMNAASNNTQAERDAIARLAKSVVKRLDQSVILRRIVAHIGEWTPTVNRCHDNVAIWVAKNPQHKHVHLHGLEAKRAVHPVDGAQRRADRGWNTVRHHAPPSLDRLSIYPAFGDRRGV
jgi:hypothetical protein